MIWAALLATWEAAYRLVGWRPWVFPAPSHILDAVLGMLNVQSDFGGPIRAGWPHLKTFSRPGTSAWYASPLITANLVSATRLVCGFALSLFLGACLGVLTWRSAALDNFFGPVFLGLQTLPSVCWVPLAIIIFGFQEASMMFVMAMGSMFAVAIAMRDGLRAIPPLYQHAGRMLGAHGWRLYRYVLLPASLPALATSLRQGFSFAWRSLMGAELILTATKNHGLGFLLDTGRNFNDVAQVMAVLVIMVLFGMAADRWFFAHLQRRIFARFGLLPAHG